MGSNETATATTGGHRIIDVFDGNGTPSGPNCLLFSDVDRFSDSLWDRSEVGWSPTPHAPVLGARQRALDRNLWQIMAHGLVAQRTLGDVSYTGSGGVGGVGDCTRPVSTLGDPRDTSGSRIDRITLARPPLTVRRPRPRIKKNSFSAPSTCPIDLFGPLASRTMLKRLQCRLLFQT